MYAWIVYLHVTVIFIFLIQHSAEIWVSYRLRAQKEPEGIDATYSFLPDNNSRNLRITYLLIILTGMTAALMSVWWRQGWLWTALGVMILIWIVMRLAGSSYLNAVDAITEHAIEHKEEASALQKFRSDLKARREPDLMMITSIVGGLVILWLMMFKPF